MKKILTLIMSLAVLSFTACSSAAATPDSKSGFEGTKVSAYLTGEYVSASESQSRLEAAGFEVIASYKSVKKGTTLVFTNDVLKSEAAKPGRAYVAALRLFVDEKEKMISFTNPVYFGKAYMQDEYNHTVFNSQLETINNAFSGLKNSIDIESFDDLAGYQYMMGMPKYDDADELAQGTNSELISKARAYKKGKLLVFELKLSETSTLLGYDLGKRTKKFVKKIGRANAAVLPYCISIENGKATSLEAKYYLALSYPLLSLGTFTTIATVPGAVKKDLAKAFK